MSNRHVSELSKVYEHLFEDASCAFPTLRDEFRKDLTRLQDSLKQRGLPLFLVDLPAVGKHLDRCLANGQYKLSGLPLTKRFSNRVTIPKFLRGLYLLVFEESGLLKQEPCHEAIFFLRQILFAAKKAKYDCGFNACQEEILAFVDIDGSLPRPSRFWSLSAPVATDVSSTFPNWDEYGWRSVCGVGSFSGLLPLERSMLLKNLDFVSGLISSTLGHYDYREWRFKHGPGAISEVTGPTNKYSWRNWSDRLEAAYPIADCGYHNFASWADTATESGVLSNEPHSRLVAVPKSYTKPRLIAAEPSEHQFCQQNLWHYFCTRVERSWISKFIRFTDQTRNQELCLRGSKDGSLSTIDLSAASDRVTCQIVGLLFRSNPGLVLALQATRTRFVQQRLTSKLPELLELNKFSTMGSACTFPVESLLFLAIALASVLTTRRMRATRSSILSLAEELAVFGDDIVIPTDSRALLFEALNLFFFEVNVDKSFWTGKFRESCGADAYAGSFITPAFWRAPNMGDPESIAMTVDVHNNFYQKFLCNTARYIASTLGKVEIPYVAVDSGVLGLKSRVGPFPACRKTRWNQDLHRMESLVPLLQVTQQKTPIEDDSGLLQYFTEAPSPFSKWSSGIAQRPKPRLRFGWVSTSDLTAQ